MGRRSCDPPLRARNPCSHDRLTTALVVQGSSATPLSRVTRDRRLCVPASRRVCPCPQRPHAPARSARRCGRYASVRGQVQPFTARAANVSTERRADLATLAGVRCKCWRARRRRRALMPRVMAAAARGARFAVYSVWYWFCAGLGLRIQAVHAAEQTCEPEQGIDVRGGDTHTLTDLAHGADQSRVPPRPAHRARAGAAPRHPGAWRSWRHRACE